MIGSGFVKTMNQTFENNRNLLKGEGQYKNFDKNQYIYTKATRQPRFKSASNEYLQSLRQQMLLEKRKTTRRMTLLGIISFCLFLMFIGALFFIKI